jgi:AmiR/NasT family two-component response regulator
MTDIMEPRSAESLHTEVIRLRAENVQLRRALETRIVIEQAKGVLAERFTLAPDQAFAVLRRAARNECRSIHELAAEIIRDAATPGAVVQALRRREAS